MDILKVLSRGIKQPAKGGKPSNNATTNLPSAGNRANPQLFHDEVKSSRGNKRKRANQDEDDSAETDSDLPDVDFFGAKKESSSKKKTSQKDQTTKTTGQKGSSNSKDEEPTEDDGEPPLPAANLLSEDECRQLLRSHRLKLTLLAGRTKKDAKVTKSKKKKKAAVEVKNEPIQLHPQCLSSFGELRSTYGISPKLASNIRHEGYKVPTEVQLASLPLLLRPDLAVSKSPSRQEVGDVSSGVDLLAVAPTGSGKTISFLIPCIDDILRNRKGVKEGEEHEHELAAVIIAPTRELVFQIVNEGRKLAVGTGIKVAGMRKGVELPTETVETSEADGASDDDENDDEDGEAKDGKKEADSSDQDSDNEDEEEQEDSPKPVTKADIIVTTPTLLHRYLTTTTSSKTRKVLPTVRSLMLDEADVLLDPLFREATKGIWSSCTNPNLRTALWSATMASNIEVMVKDMLTTTTTAAAATTQTPPKHHNPLVRLVVGLKDAAVPNITHKLTYAASEQGKLLAIRHLLHPQSGHQDPSDGPPLRPPFLVFTQTIDRATALEEELRYDIPLSAGGPTRIAALHSNLSEKARAGIMRRFRAGDIWILITTDVLARGVDFAGVNGIVNYDIPGSAAAYVHRAGRTGRAGREGGVAVTLYTKDDIPFVKTVANVIAVSEKQAGKTGDEAGVQKWLLDALPDVSKDDRKKLKERGVESRRSGHGHGSGGSGGAGARITTKSGWERKKENNRQGAIEGSKKRRREAKLARREGGGDVSDGEWGGIAD